MIEEPTEEEVERVLGARTTRQGWRILTIPHSVIPDYDLDAVCEGLTDEQIRQEVYIDWSASSAKRIFPTFSDIHIAREPLRFDPRRPLVCGWDVGLSATPAWVPTQISPLGQWFIYPPVVGRPNATTQIHDFGEMVAAHLLREYAVPHRLRLEDLSLIHYGDPAGNARPPRTKATTDDRIELRSAHEIIRDGMEVVVGYARDGDAEIERLPGWGWHIQPGAVALSERLEAIRARLKLLLNGRPALIVDPRAEPIIAGFNGAYHYKQRADGSYEDKPDKNWHSHCMDALQYVATRLFAAGVAEEDEDDRPARREWRSHASGRRG